jgi:type IV pilus assembly protein PilM
MATMSLSDLLKPTGDLVRRLTTVRAQEAKVTVGLDIGSTSVKTVALGARKGAGPRPVLGRHLAPIGGKPEPDVAEAIKIAVSALPVPVHAVAISVSGQWVITRVVEMPTMKPAEMKQALPFEAQRYLPFNIQDVVVDGVVLGPADAAKSWVLVVAGKKDLLGRRMDWVKQAGLSITLIDVDALALANGFLAGQNGRRAEGTRALMNAGAQFVNLVMFQGDVPYLVRDIPWGGDKLVRNSAEQLGLEPAAVMEQLVTGAPSAECLSAMKLSTEALVTELQLSFDYFESRFGQPPETVLVSGGLGQSTAFLDVLKSHLTQSVAPWTPASELPCQFAVAYGLALRAD